MKYLFLILFIQNIYGANLVLDIGHTPKKNGATSSTCEQEYKYNPSGENFTAITPAEWPCRTCEQTHWWNARLCGPEGHNSDHWWEPIR